MNILYVFMVNESKLSHPSFHWTYLFMLEMYTLIGLLGSSTKWDLIIYAYPKLIVHMNGRLLVLNVFVSLILRVLKMTIANA
jgi:hypothetical protein